MFSKAEIHGREEQTFRELFAHLLDSPDVTAILLGENHEISPTFYALSANLDLLLNSKRRPVLIFENLRQEDNQKLVKLLDKRWGIPHKKIEFIKNKSLDFFSLCLSALNRGITICGIETEETNPFKIPPEGKVSMTLIRAMETFQKSSGRIQKTNEIFSEFIQHYCQEDVIPIFIGGAAHCISLYEKGSNHLFDPGIQGRIAGSVSLYLSFSSIPSFDQKASYLNEERSLQGVYNYQINSNIQSLYQDSFDSFLTTEDKISFLTSCIDDLIRAYLCNSKRGASLLKSETNILVEAFKKSENMQEKLSSSNDFTHKLIRNLNIEDSRSETGFFAQKKSAKNTYSKELLEKILRQQLEELRPINQEKPPL